MSKNIVTSNCSLDTGTYTAASTTITCAKSCKADGYDIYYSTMTVTLATVTDASGNVCPTIVATISPSATKNKINGMAVLLEGDSGSGSGTFTNSATGATVVETVNVKISSAGQSKVKGV